MTLRRMALAAVLVLTVVFLSPIAYMAGQRASLWLTTPVMEPVSPWPSLEEGEHDPGLLGERFTPGGGGVVDI
jgi:hypothetical protein